MFRVIYRICSFIWKLKISAIYDVNIHLVCAFIYKLYSSKGNLPKQTHFNVTSQVHDYSALFPNFLPCRGNFPQFFYFIWKHFSNLTFILCSQIIYCVQMLCFSITMIFFHIWNRWQLQGQLYPLLHCVICYLCLLNCAGEFFFFLTDVVNRRKRRGCAIPFNSCAFDNKDMGNKNDSWHISWSQTSVEI